MGNILSRQPTSVSFLVPSIAQAGRWCGSCSRREKPSFYKLTQGACAEWGLTNSRLWSTFRTQNGLRLRNKCESKTDLTIDHLEGTRLL